MEKETTDKPADVKPATVQLASKPGRKKHKIIFGVLILSLVLIGSAGYFLFYDAKEVGDKTATEETDKVYSAEEIQKIDEEQQNAGAEAEGASGNLDQAKLESFSLNTDPGNSSAAVAGIREVLNTPGLSEDEIAKIYGDLYGQCTLAEDFDCLEFVVLYQEKVNDGKPNVWFYVDTARLAKKQNRVDQAKDYYKKALDLTNSLGGEKHLESVNKVSDDTIEYKELTDGAA